MVVMPERLRSVSGSHLPQAAPTMFLDSRQQLSPEACDIFERE